MELFEQLPHHHIPPQTVFNWEIISFTGSGSRWDPNAREELAQTFHCSAWPLQSKQMQKSTSCCVLFLKLTMRAEPQWEVSEWAMRHYSDSPCGCIVLLSAPKMGSRQFSFGQHGSLLSRNRSLKKQANSLRSFDNGTNFMLIALWRKVMMHHLMLEIQAKLKNLSIKCHDTFGAYIRGFFAVTRSDLLGQSSCII